MDTLVPFLLLLSLIGLASSQVDFERACANQRGAIWSPGSRSCFLYFKRPLSWADSMFFCHLFKPEGTHGRLAHIPNPKVLQMLRKRIPSESFWIGMKSTVKGSPAFLEHWRWFDDLLTMIPRQPWNPIPFVTISMGKRERCMNFGHSNWQQTPCEEELPFLCEYVPEPQHFCSMLNNSIWLPKSDSCALPVTKHLPWTEAMYHCDQLAPEEMQGRLVHITTADTFHRLRNLLPHQFMWVGMKTQKDGSKDFSNDWKWMSDPLSPEILDHPDWSPMDEAVIRLNQEEANCLNMVEGRFNDYYCTESLPFVCEFRKLDKNFVHRDLATVYRSVEEAVNLGEPIKFIQSVDYSKFGETTSGQRRVDQTPRNKETKPTTATPNKISQSAPAPTKIRPISSSSNRTTTTRPRLVKTTTEKITRQPVQHAKSTVRTTTTKTSAVPQVEKSATRNSATRSVARKLSRDSTATKLPTTTVKPLTTITVPQSPTKNYVTQRIPSFDAAVKINSSPPFLSFNISSENNTRKIQLENSVPEPTNTEVVLTPRTTTESSATITPSMEEFLASTSTAFDYDEWRAVIEEDTTKQPETNTTSSTQTALVFVLSDRSSTTEKPSTQRPSTQESSTKAPTTTTRANTSTKQTISSSTTPSTVTTTTQKPTTSTTSPLSTTARIENKTMSQTSIPETSHTEAPIEISTAPLVPQRPPPIEEKTFVAAPKLTSNINQTREWLSLNFTGTTNKPVWVRRSTWHWALFTGPQRKVPSLPTTTTPPTTTTEQYDKCDRKYEQALIEAGDNRTNVERLKDYCDCNPNGVWSYETGTCLAWYRRARQWKEAMERCIQIAPSYSEGRLAHLDNPIMLDYVRSLFGKSTFFLWIGLQKRIGVEGFQSFRPKKNSLVLDQESPITEEEQTAFPGQWRWMDSTDTTSIFLPWNPEQYVRLSLRAENGNCMVFRSIYENVYTWVGTPCNLYISYLCEYVPLPGV